MNVNVGSGYLVLEGFVNLDNSIFLKIARSPFYFLIKPLLSAGKKEGVKNFREASKKAELRLYECRKRMPFQDQSISHILSSHFLEHIFHDQCAFLLREFYRTLKPGGTLHIILPDLEKLIEEYRQNKSDDAADILMEKILAYDKPGLSLRNRMLDLTGNFGFHHLWMYDRKSMEKKLQQVGFEIDNTLLTPSANFRFEDGSLHIKARKPNFQ